MEYKMNVSPTELYRIEAEARRMRAEAVRDAFSGLRHRMSALFSRRATHAA